MTIEFKVETMSNLYIGGTPRTYDIGGVDMYTVTDNNGKPYIPASSFKGALREIAKDNPIQGIADLYEQYLLDNQAAFEKGIKGRDGEVEFKERYQALIDDPRKDMYIFGIEAFNTAPKLIFFDINLTDDATNAKNSLIIDMKNSIEEDPSKRDLISNPRTYQVARKGLVFEGSISFYRFNALDGSAEGTVSDYIIECIKQFELGVYRVGNSKSRGYGWVSVKPIEDLT
jgi:CRISPR-associated protein Csm3